MPKARRVSWVGHISPVLRPRLRGQLHDPKITGLFNFDSFRAARDDVREALDYPAPTGLDAHVFQGKVLSAPQCTLLVHHLHDLPPAHKDTLRTWTHDPKLVDINNADDLRAALQVALEVEIATIPPYLAAMYSIVGNDPIRDTFHRIIYQEMEHFGLAANMLLSIGGTPDCLSAEITSPYPKDLPGMLGNGLIIRIRKLNAGLEADADGNTPIPDPDDWCRHQIALFMAIEKPAIWRKPKKKNDVYTVDEEITPTGTWNTIGELYRELLDGFQRLYKSGEITFGHSDLQVKSDWKVSVSKILEMVDVEAAIEKICDEGEGLSLKGKGLDPTNPQTGKMAHYFAFSEIFYQKQIEVQMDEGEVSGFTYSGDAVDMNKLTILNMRDDPKLSSLSEDEDGYEPSLNFCKSWLFFLGCLNVAFSGTPQKIAVAISAMSQLRTLGMVVMQTELEGDGDQTYGMTFEIPPDCTPLK